MMTKERGKDNIRSFLGKENFPIIRIHPFRIISHPSLFRNSDTMGVVVDAGNPYGYPMPLTPPAQHPQIIPAATSDLANAYPPPVPDQTLQPFYTNRMAAQPGIDHIQFLHVLFDI